MKKSNVPHHAPPRPHQKTQEHTHTHHVQHYTTERMPRGHTRDLGFRTRVSVGILLHFHDKVVKRAAKEWPSRELLKSLPRLDDLFSTALLMTLAGRGNTDGSGPSAGRRGRPRPLFSGSPCLSVHFRQNIANRPEGYLCVEVAAPWSGFDDTWPSTYSIHAHRTNVSDQRHTQSLVAWCSLAVVRRMGLGVCRLGVVRASARRLPSGLGVGPSVSILFPIHVRVIWRPVAVLPQACSTFAMRSFTHTSWLLGMVGFEGLELSEPPFQPVPCGRDSFHG